ncbi:hypothetical protein LAD12857_03540 [Lacrimispora amygdalina]|uniref:Putative Se/S carrier protein-like domain-containing protein n=1 Tax=Lacrimispora amygdalina TaxID=253257 RepID=A0ABQ5M0G9_9FIRM
MRQKELKSVVTFHTVTEAIAMETACMKENIPGRIIPVPREIKAGCGLSWSMPVSWEGDLSQWMEEKGLKWESIGEYFI